MGKIMEAVFCAAYLILTSVLGFRILMRSKANKHAQLFGTLTLVLVGGDAFHLIPRIIGALAGKEFIAALGFGTLVTSITMTVFYVLLFVFIAQLSKTETHKPLSMLMFLLAAVRIALLCFPQNQWLSANSPLTWGIYRNIPFVLMGGIVVVLLYKHLRTDKFFHYAWLAVLLSFVFYIPVVLFADAYPIVGMLMLPKTVCYVWLISMGYIYAKQ